jgi:hypothetical protein
MLLLLNFSGHSIESYGGKAGKVKLSRLQKIAICEGDYCWEGIKKSGDRVTAVIG